MKLAWDSSTRREGKPLKYVRERSADPYHSARWTRLSLRWRDSHPLCARCAAKGVIAAAECVDHIEPYPIHSDFFDESNLQSLCNRCNMEKGNEDRKRIQEWKKNQLSKVKMKVGGENL